MARIARLKTEARALYALIATVLLLTACGGTSRSASSPTAVDCHFAPKGSPHAQAAAEGLACPSKRQRLGGPLRGVPLVEMDDSTDASVLPSWVGRYAGYTDGLYNDYGQIRARFPAATTVGITVFMQIDSRAADSEPGNPSPDTMARWAYNEINGSSPNKRPVEYTMQAWQSWLEQANASLGIPRCSSSTQQGCYLEWIASWDGVPSLNVAHAAAKQFIDHGPSFENYDRSVVDPAMLFAAPPPANLTHYERYAQQSLATPWGASTRQEYAWTWNYDWARPYYGKTAYFNRLVVDLQVKLRWFAGQLLYRINHTPAAQNYALWRYSREREALNRVKGRVCATYETCNN